MKRRITLTKTLAAIMLALSTSIAIAYQGCYVGCAGDNCVCAHTGQTFPYIVPAGFPCAGAHVTANVYGTWYGPTVRRGSPGYTGYQAYTDPQRGCGVFAYYTCNGQDIGFSTVLMGLYISTTHSC